MLLRLPKIVAFADVLAVFCYIGGLSPIFGQSIALAVKLLLLPMLMRKDSMAMRQGESLLVLCGLCAMTLAFSPSAEWIDVYPILGFLGHLILTLLLTREELGEYLRSVAMLIGATALIYLVMLAGGLIPVVFGRNFYFGDLHPNLGAEIAAAGVVCAVISLRYRTFLAIAVVCLTNAIFMEGRSAMLAIVMMVAFRSVHEAFIARDRSRLQIKLILATPVAVILVLLALPYITQSLMLTDKYRGVGTGFVGRTDQWQLSLDAFFDRPLTGQGLGWFDRTQDLGAHNFFLYGLAEMGLLSVVIYAMLGHMAVVAFRQYGWKVVNITPIFVLFLMNDRFMNLNPYPYLVWVLFFALSSPPLPDQAAAAVAASARDFAMGVPRARAR